MLLKLQQVFLKECAQVSVCSLCVCTNVLCYMPTFQLYGTCVCCLHMCTALPEMRKLNRQNGRRRGKFI